MFGIHCSTLEQAYSFVLAHTKRERVGREHPTSPRRSCNLTLIGEDRIPLEVKSGIGFGPDRCTALLQASLLADFDSGYMSTDASWLLLKTNQYLTQQRDTLTSKARKQQLGLFLQAALASYLQPID